MPPPKPSLSRIPKSIPHTLPGLATDDLIDSAQSSDLQTNMLFQLETGVTATEPELSVDDKSFLRATDVSRNNGGWLGRYLPPVLLPTGESQKNTGKVGSKRKSGDGSLLPLLITVQKINLCDNAGGAAGVGLPAVGESEMKSVFRGFPDVAFTPQFNPAWERRDDRRGGYHRSNHGPVSSRHSQRTRFWDRDLRRYDCNRAAASWFICPSVPEFSPKILLYLHRTPSPGQTFSPAPF